MSPFIILTLIAVLYLCSKPRLRRFVERDGVYLTRNWTSFVNALFITLVVCSHGLNLFQTNICDYLPEKCAAFAVGQFGQLMVTTFFFFSGYGIMFSLLNRGGYEGNLIYPRFIILSLNFVLAVLVYFIAHCILQGEIRWSDFLGGLHDYQFLGNPTWFILMTLLTYLLTYASFRCVGKDRPVAFILLLMAVLVIVIYLFGQIKPSHWVNTILCFPAGMLYYIKGEQIEHMLRKTSIPSIVYSLLLLLLGKLIYDADLWPNIYTENIGGILFAVGVMWFVGSFSWGKPSRFLTWLGGSGLFVVYMFHLLPMRIMTHLGLNEEQPYMVWLCVFITTAFIVLMAQFCYQKLNRVLFSK